MIARVHVYLTTVGSYYVNILQGTTAQTAAQAIDAIHFSRAGGAAGAAVCWVSLQVETLATAITKSSLLADVSLGGAALIIWPICDAITIVVQCIRAGWYNGQVRLVVILRVLASDIGQVDLPVLVIVNTVAAARSDALIASLECVSRKAAAWVIGPVGSAIPIVVSSV